MSSEDVKYQPEGSHEDTMVVLSGELNREQRAELESKLKFAPNDLRARLLLLGYFLREQCTAKGPEKSKAARIYANHMLWMVDHHPRHLLHANMSGFTEDEFFSEIKSHWEAQVSTNPEDVTVLHNAARFLLFADPLYSADLLQTASLLDDTNDLFPAELCGIYMRLFDDSQKSDKKKFAKLAIKELKVAIKRYEKYSDAEKRKSFTYKFDIEAQEVAGVAIECKLLSEARNIAKLVLNRTADVQIRNVIPNFRRGEAYGRISSTNTGNAILGQVALAQGNTLLATKHLDQLIVIDVYDHIEAKFATELLRSGEQDAVVQYLKRVRELFKTRLKAGRVELNQSRDFVWKQNHAKLMNRKLSVWIREIEKGRTPRITR
ncbi:MAG: hypothetical protein HYX67_12080 [Candidatus Melainabacteria bacterium]|nr:hypothetical protein [Candidatus Melainabacteria bacterium]